MMLDGTIPTVLFGIVRRTGPAISSGLLVSKAVASALLPSSSVERVWATAARRHPDHGAIWHLRRCGSGLMM